MALKQHVGGVRSFMHVVDCTVYMRHEADGNVHVVLKERFVIKGCTMFYRTTTRKKIFTIPAVIITLMIRNPKAQQVKLQVHQSFHPPQISKSQHDRSDESEHSETLTVKHTLHVIEHDYPL